jgi:TorA maturation chaperone TorD
VLGEIESIAVRPAPAEVPAEEELRANMYGLIAMLLRAPPDSDSLAALAGLSHDDSEMGLALAALVEAARRETREDIEDEYNALFVGVGKSELSPYGSYYLAGFMYEKPLAILRGALSDLGIARAEDAGEPEDHIAALCETMCALILGRFGPAASLAAQRAFFDDHIAPWAERFFADLQTAGSARFYRPVGAVGAAFMHIEAQSFEMAG